MFDTDDGMGAQALDQNQLARRLQFSVAEGCAVSPGTNDLTVQVDAGEVIFDGASVSVAAQDNVALTSPDSADPRKDVVYVDTNGDIQIATGTPEPTQPAGQIRRDTYRPAPPDLAAMNAAVLAEVWVSAQASDIVVDDISDRRLFADAAFRNVESESVSTDDQTINNNLTFGSHDVGAILEAQQSSKLVNFGTYSQDPGSSASDGTWDTKQGQSTTVTFDTAFSSTPDVLVVSPRSNEVLASFFNLSSTGFDGQVVNYTTTDVGAITVDFVAIGDS